MRAGRSVDERTVPDDHVTGTGAPAHAIPGRAYSMSGGQAAFSEATRCKGAGRLDRRPAPGGLGDRRRVRGTDDGVGVARPAPRHGSRCGVHGGSPARPDGTGRYLPRCSPRAMVAGQRDPGEPRLSTGHTALMGQDRRLRQVGSGVLGLGMATIRRRFDARFHCRGGSGSDDLLGLGRETLGGVFGQRA
jgi:hypothetical protein